MSDTQAAMREFRFLDEKRKTNGLTPAEHERWLELGASLGVDPPPPEQPAAGYYGQDGQWYQYPPGYETGGWPAQNPPWPGYYQPAGYYDPNTGGWYAYPGYIDPNTGAYYPPPPTPYGYPPQWPQQPGYADAQRWPQQPGFPQPWAPPPPGWPPTAAPTAPQDWPPPQAGGATPTWQAPQESQATWPQPQAPAEGESQWSELEATPASTPPMDFPLGEAERPGEAAPVAEAALAPAPEPSPAPDAPHDEPSTPLEAIAFDSIDATGPTDIAGLEPAMNAGVDAEATALDVSFDASGAHEPVGGDSTPIEEILLDPALVESVPVAASDVAAATADAPPPAATPPSPAPAEEPASESISQTVPVPKRLLDAAVAESRADTASDRPSPLPFFAPGEKPALARGTLQLFAVAPAPALQLSSPTPPPAITPVAPPLAPPSAAAAPEALPEPTRSSATAGLTSSSSLVELSSEDFADLPSPAPAADEVMEISDEELVDVLPGPPPSTPEPPRAAAPIDPVEDLRQALSFDEAPPPDAPPKQSAPAAASARPSSVIRSAPAPDQVPAPIAAAPVERQPARGTPVPHPAFEFNFDAPPPRSAAPPAALPSRMPPPPEPQPVVAAPSASVSAFDALQLPPPPARMPGSSGVKLDDHPTEPVVGASALASLAGGWTSEAPAAPKGTPVRVSSDTPVDFAHWHSDTALTDSQDFQVETDLTDFVLESAAPSARASAPAAHRPALSFDRPPSAPAPLQSAPIAPQPAMRLPTPPASAVEPRAAPTPALDEGAEEPLIEGELLPETDAQPEVEPDVPIDLDLPSPLFSPPPPPASRSGELPKFTPREAPAQESLPQPSPYKERPSPVPRVPAASAEAAAVTVAGEHRVILHTMEGGVKRGTICDANLTAATIVLQTNPGVTETVPRERVKAIFFMLAPGTSSPDPQGTKVRVTFRDGRQVAGYSKDSRSSAAGFFVVPADHRTNTERIFIYRHGVTSVTVEQ